MDCVVHFVRLRYHRRMKMLNQISPERCPHCSVSRPTMNIVFSPTTTVAHDGQNQRSWSIYQCTTCGGVVLTRAPNFAITSPPDKKPEIEDMWPQAESVSDALPEKPRAFLSQAIASLHAPAGAIMLAASSIDAMLKDKGHKKGNLSDRIDEASKNHLITSEMAAWAHEIRLDANDQRHADENAPLPTEADAKKVIDFAKALAEFLYVLPAMVTRGRKPAPGTTTVAPSAKP